MEQNHYPECTRARGHEPREAKSGGGFGSQDVQIWRPMCPVQPQLCQSLGQLEGQ